MWPSPVQGRCASRSRPAIARGAEKAPFAKQLGAAHYIDSTSQDVAKELTKLGGAAVVLATVTDAKSMAALFGATRRFAASFKR
jgi:alcohol dehydrogenase